MMVFLHVNMVGTTGTPEQKPTMSLRWCTEGHDCTKLLLTLVCL